MSASVGALARNTSFSALLAGSATQSSSWTLFGAAEGAVFTPTVRALRAELHANGSGTKYGSNTSARLLGGGRLHLSAQRLGTWVGLSAGSVTDPIGVRGIRLGEAGLWALLGPAVAHFVVTPVRIAGGLDYTDTEGTIRFSTARFELGAVGGFRSDIAGYQDSPRAWASVNGIAWLLRAVGVTAAAGSYPADVGQGLPSAKYISLGIRVAPKRIIPALPPLPSGGVLLERRPISSELTISADVDGSRTITFRAPSARRVEIMGDFTDWTPVEMTRGQRPETWVATLPITGGLHQVNVRVDGGEWRVPASLTPVRDEFGGSVGVLVVP
ncbi:MAG: glycogen-binding domain-containing protein [Gemmatimonadaceae bacterium]